MDPQPDVIRSQIEETRSSLTEKLETLEAEVKGTVQEAKETVLDTFQNAKETVSETIETVKDTVESAKESVKRTFDVSYQVNERPWTMMGISLVAGLATGALVGGSTNTSARVARGMSRASAPPEDQPGYGHASSSASFLSGGASTSRKPGFFDKLTSQLAGEFDQFKDVAVAALVQVVHDMAQQAAPALRQGVEQMLHQARERFTGQAPQGGQQPSASGPAYGSTGTAARPYTPPTGTTAHPYTPPTGMR